MALIEELKNMVTNKNIGLSPYFVGPLGFRRPNKKLIKFREFTGKNMVKCMNQRIYNLYL
ncbi:hypothetical protein C1646_685177 [Rhizophagus diaphanus]|nr:hypothetical protein C1646_685177 [Rhizophagus diaphanus] [Rhizophagus sp. MUCL 43196]